MKESLGNIFGNLNETIIPTIIGQIILMIWGRFKINKEWIRYEKTFLRIYMFFKPFVDVLISFLSYLIFGIIGVFLIVITKDEYWYVLMMLLNIGVIVIYEIVANKKTNSKDYIYENLKYTWLRIMINLIYYAPAVMLVGRCWAAYSGKMVICNVCTVLYYIFGFSYVFYKPVNRKSNKYVDIFTDTRKSYLNVECENISQKGQWYFIKEGNTTRKIRKERVSEFICHD